MEKKNIYMKNTSIGNFPASINCRSAVESKSEERDKNECKNEELVEKMTWFHYVNTQMCKHGRAHKTNIDIGFVAEFYLVLNMGTRYFFKSSVTVPLERGVHHINLNLR